MALSIVIGTWLYASLLSGVWISKLKGVFKKAMQADFLWKRPIVTPEPEIAAQKRKN